MKREILTIDSNVCIAADVYRMQLSGCTQEHHSGQFVDIAIDGFFLRRPISVCDYTPGILTIVYKVVGKGTAVMAGMESGQTLDVLTGLGHGFNPAMAGEKPLLVGGGLGAAPMLLLAKEIVAAGRKPSVILGFNRAADVVLQDEFRAIGIEPVIATADGSLGVKGFVTDALPMVEFDHYHSCGPLPMLKALTKATAVPGEISLEERMGCGTGICMGCTCSTLLGPRRVCKDGPVFNSEDISW